MAKLHEDARKRVDDELLSLAGLELEPKRAVAPVGAAPEPRF